MNTIVETSSPSSVARRRVVSSLFVAMLLITVGVSAANSFLHSINGLSIVWTMVMVFLASYWLRLFLADWMKRINMESADEDCETNACNPCIGGACG